jgi:IclR family transcriptional regulator, mhp operon transcriptional activator
MVSEPFKRVRALQRGLSMLESLSFLESYSASEVSRRVSLPRATALRLLETLERHGYAARRPADSSFRLTAKSAGLGDGLDASVALGLVSGPILVELGQEIRWPADVFSFERGAMVIQESTNARSPLSLDPDRVGGRFPVLSSAAGRAFLAACRRDQRSIILRSIDLLGDPSEREHLNDRSCLAFVDRAEEEGYAVRHGHETGRKTSSLGVAIVQDGLPYGSLSTRWLDSALEFPTATEQLLPQLQRAAVRIGALIRSVMRVP